MNPKVSILLPNLNNRPYLDERMDSIISQTYKDWELVIVDYESDDGAWEFFQEWMPRDPRIRLSRAPRKGLYANWNNCIGMARGKYIYIATSDDTMTPDFLEIMVQILEDNPDCHLAHCKLKIIDEEGKAHPDLDWDKFYCSRFFGDLVDKEHIRRAPHDGILHCGIKTVYTSITQLLIRKSLFERIGLFLTQDGSIADFEWAMRASLVANTYHVPHYLATWRIHKSQETSLDFLKTPQYRIQLLKLLKHAVMEAKQIEPGLINGVNIKSLQYLYRKECFRLELSRHNKQVAGRGQIYRLWKACQWLIKDPEMFWEGFLYFLHMIRGKRRPFISRNEPLEFSKKLLQRMGATNNIEIKKDAPKE